MNILIRLPNWLGDMVMSTAFVQAVKEHFPGASIDLIAKKGLDFLLDHFPVHGERYLFSKEEYKGLTGAVRFGQSIRSQKDYDLFFCLPDSFSSAIMGFTIAAKKRIGFKKELRAALLTHSYQKKKGVHRVEEYIDLLQQYAEKEIPIPEVQLTSPPVQRKNALIININSEASSRRLPKEKAIQVINAVRNKINHEIILVGSNKEKDFVDEVYSKLGNRDHISNMAGQTDLQQLVTLMSSCPAILTTDSGPAHVANALGLHTIILFGAGNENNTAPYNKKNRSIIRLGKLDCEPCVSNDCKLYGIPQCLVRLDENLIASEVYNVLK